MIPALNPYASAKNPERIREILDSGSAGPSGHARPPGNAPGVSVVILNLNKPELIVPLLGDLLRQACEFEREGLRLEILVGDTGSTDPAVLRCYEELGGRITVVRGLKYHFSKNNNQVAFEHAGCEAVLFLNNDVIFEKDGPSAILKMYRQLQLNPRVGVVGMNLFFQSGRIQHAGIDWSRDPAIRGFCFHPHAGADVRPEALPAVRSCDAVTGACLMIRSEAFWKVGGMDGKYQAECQDIALCLGAHRLGWRAVVVNGGRVVHLENATRPKGEENWPDRQRMMRKWGAYIEARFL